MAQWYVIYTKPRQEAVALENLQRQNYTVLYPRARLQKRKAGQGSVAVVEPLFPRYMFVRLKTGVDDFSKLRSTKGCVDLVKFGGKASTVPDDLINFIHARADADYVIDLQRANELQVGGKVRVAEGPLEGFMGTIALAKSDHRVIVLLNIMGAERNVELRKDQLDQA